MPIPKVRSFPHLKLTSYNLKITGILLENLQDHTGNEPILDIHIGGSVQDIINTECQIHVICNENIQHVLCSSSKHRSIGQKTIKKPESIPKNTKQAFHRILIIGC